MSDSAEEIVFARAVVLAPAERAACLAEACGADAALRAAVESLLRAHDAVGDFFAPPRLAPEFSPPPAEATGDRIDRYRLLEKIGEGGCGVVFLAEQFEPVRRQVALKVIKLGVDTRAVIARFAAERQALARMDHPHIARVFDAGATAAGRPFFVTEFVPGARVTDFCDRGQLTLADRLRLFIHVCRAVHHAHQKGIIHRDLKPANILVSVQDGTPAPKVIDFGIAKAVQDGPGDETGLTASDQFIGTPDYMSPEQLATGGLDLDTRSDIYALGVVLYELLTGRRPFPGATASPASLEERRREMRERGPVRPSTCVRALDAATLATIAGQRRITPAKLVASLGGDLDWIVLKCLETERTRRYESAAALARDLERHLAHEPVAAAAPDAAYVLGKFIRRHRVGLVAGSFATAALVTGLTVATWLYLRERAMLARARYAEQKAVDGFRAALAQKSAASVVLRELPPTRAALDTAVVAARREWADRPAVQAGVWEAFATAYAELGEGAVGRALRAEAAGLRR